MSSLGDLLDRLHEAGASFRFAGDGRVFLRGGRRLPPELREQAIGNRVPLAALARLRAARPPVPPKLTVPPVEPETELEHRRRLRRLRLDRLAWARGVLAFAEYQDAGGPVGADLLGGVEEPESRPVDASNPYRLAPPAPARPRRNR